MTSFVPGYMLASNANVITTGAMVSSNLQMTSTVATTWSTSDSTSGSYSPYPNELSIINNQLATTNSFAGIFFQGGQLTAGSQIHSARIGVINDGTTYGAAMAFATRNPTSATMTEAVRISSTGNVGIATSTIAAGRQLSVWGGNIHVGSTNSGLLFSDGSYMASAPGYAFFSAYQSVSQSLTNAVDTKLTFTTVDYDTANAYNSGTSTFTAPVAGFYWFDASVRTGTGTSNCRFDMGFYVNGTMVFGYGHNQTNSNGMGCAIIGVIPLTAGQAVTVYANQNSGSTVTTDLTSNLTGGTPRISHFQGYLMRALP